MFGIKPVLEWEVINSFAQQASLNDVDAKDTKPEEGSSDKTLENVSKTESRPVSDSDSHCDSNTEEDFVTFAELAASQLTSVHFLPWKILFHFMK